MRVKKKVKKESDILNTDIEKEETRSENIYDDEQRDEITAAEGGFMAGREIEEKEEERFRVSERRT